MLSRGLSVEEVLRLFILGRDRGKSGIQRVVALCCIVS